jgi:hypothetical protein
MHKIAAQPCRYANAGACVGQRAEVHASRAAAGAPSFWTPATAMPAGQSTLCLAPRRRRHQHSLLYHCMRRRGGAAAHQNAHHSVTGADVAFRPGRARTVATLATLCADFNTSTRPTRRANRRYNIAQNNAPLQAGSGDHCCNGHHHDGKRANRRHVFKAAHQHARRQCGTPSHVAARRHRAFLRPWAQKLLAWANQRPKNAAARRQVAS